MPEVEQTDAAVEQPGSGPVPAEQETEQAEAKPKEEAPKVEAETEEESEAGEQKPKRLGGWQRKIAKLEQENEYWRDEALRNRSGSQAEPPKAPTKPVAPKLSTFEGTVPEFEKAQEQYAKDLEAYHASQAQQQLVQKQSQEALSQMHEQLQAMPDYDAIDDTATEELPHELIQPLAWECAQVKNGATVFRELVMDPDLRDDLLRMHRNQDGIGIKALIRAEAIALRRQPQAEKESSPAKEKPKPPNPVKKSAPTDTGLSDDLPVDEWMRRRNAQVRKQREGE